jgi:hypothetical protein
VLLRSKAKIMNAGVPDGIRPYVQGFSSEYTQVAVAVVYACNMKTCFLITTLSIFKARRR